jgi:DnaJ family protein C protein 19
VIFLLLGGVTLLVLMGAIGAFSRAQVATIKAFGFWTAAIGGLALGAMLLLTGRGALALGALGLLGPLLWSWLGEARRSVGERGPGSGGPGRGGDGRGGSARGAGGMSRAEAYEVLGLKPGAPRDDVIAAHRRLMRGAHPDSGGSDWLASRINQARDKLLS